MQTDQDASIEGETGTVCRVLVVVGAWPGPGRPALPFVKAQVDALASLGVSSDVLVVRGPRGLKYASAALAMPRRAREAYDLVHAHYGFCGWVARVQRRRPVVVSFLGDDLLGTANASGHRTLPSRLFVEANRWLARIVDAVIVKSPRMAAVLAPKPVHVIPNGVDVTRFRPMPRVEACRALGFDPAAQYVLFPADPGVPVKNFQLARRVFDLVAHRLTRRAELLTLGRVDHSLMPLYFNAASVVLFTSFSEGSPNVVKEAMSCNVPMVSVAVGDVPDLLAGVDGCDVGAYDAEWLASRLLARLEETPTCGSRAVICARGLDSVTSARRVLDVYRQVIR